MTFTYASNVITQANEASQPITAVADGDSNTLILSVTVHGYSAGDLVEVASTTSYDGIYLIDSVNTNDLTIPDTDVFGVQNLFGSSETGDIARGDKGLGGLSGLTGVTISGEYYSLDGVRLIINGALYFNAIEERIIFSNNPSGADILTINGNLRIEAGREINGLNAPRLFPAIDFGDLPTFSNNEGIINISATGKALLEGAYFFDSGGGSGEPMDLDGDLSIKNCLIADRRSLAGNSRFVLRDNSFFSSSESFLIGMTFDLSAANLNISSLTLEESREPLLVKGGSRYIPYSNLDVSGSFFERIRTNTGVDDIVIELINYGSTSVEFRKSNVNTEHTLILSSNLSLSLLDSNLASIDAKVYGVDVNNGERKGSAITAPGFTTLDATQDIIYSGTSSGGTLSIRVYLTIYYGAAGESSPTGDFRGPHDFSFYQYGYVPQSIRPDLEGLGDKSRSVILPSDLLISEANKATVDSYTEAETPQKAYDRLAAYLYDNYTGQTETIVTLTNGALDCHALNLNIDASAANVVSLIGSLLTIKATTFTGDIITTGSITLSNGATIDGVYTDSSGTVYPPVSFIDFPTGNNANGVAYDCVLAILNTNDATLFTADASSGNVDKRLSEIGDGVGPFTVWGDGVGLIRSNEFTITSTRRDDFSFSGLFNEFTAEDGTVIIGLAPAESGLSYDQSNTRFELASGSYTFHGLAHQKEVLTSSQMGQSFDNTAVRAIEFIQNSFAKTIILPSPFQVSATDSAETSPLITDCVIIRSDGADPYEHGLSSTASGLTDRPEVRVAFQSPTQSFAISSIATDAITADAIASDAITEMQAGLSTLNEAGVRAAVGLSVANLDTQIGDIPTVSEFNARTLASADYFDSATDPVILPAAPTNWITADALDDGAVADIQSGLSSFDHTSDQVTVTANNDKSGYSLTQAFPTNFSALGINASGHIGRVTLVDTTATNTDMRGTDGANAIAPDNSSIASILVDTGTIIPNLIAEVPTILEFEARTLPSADYFAPSTDTVARVTLVDTTTANTDMRGTDGANTIAPDNAGIAAIPTDTLSATDSRLNNLDAAISSRSDFDSSADGVIVATLPTIPTSWVTDIQNGLGSEAKQDTIIANIAAINPSDATLANQATILGIVADLSDLRGFTLGQPMTSDTSSNTITANGKTITITESGDQRTYTRS